MSLVLVALLPLVVAFGIARGRGWDPAAWSASETRWRTWLAVSLSVVLAVAGLLAVEVGAWLLGPDCGAEPTAAVRVRILGFALVVAVCAAAVPVAVAGRRRLVLVAAMPAVVCTVAGVAAAASNQSGWCLF